MTQRVKKKATAKAGHVDLPDAEMEVLAYLWNQRKATAREVREALAHYRPMAHGSAVTLLKRLLGKGLVKREKAKTGKAFIYRPTRQPGPTYRKILGDLLQRIFSDDGVALVSSLFDSRPPTADELEQLQQLLDDCRTKARKKERKR